jgi:site-specific DNA recombinase
VPSAELETGVTERIGQFLTDRSALFEALQPIEPDLRRLQQQTARAAEIASGLSRANRPELAAMLRKLVARISVREDRLEIAVVPTALLALLRGTAPPNRSAETECVADREEPVLLSVPVALRRAGKEMRLLVDAPGGTMRADPVLIRMLVRAHALKAKLLQSGDDSTTEVADAEGVSRSYLTRLVRLAFLSPEIVGAILEGRQPADLTPARLSRLTRLPLEWSEQRKTLGFG